MALLPYDWCCRDESLWVVRETHLHKVRAACEQEGEIPRFLVAISQCPCVETTSHCLKLRLTSESAMPYVNGDGRQNNGNITGPSHIDNLWILRVPFGEHRTDSSWAFGGARKMFLFPRPSRWGLSQAKEDFRVAIARSQHWKSLEVLPDLYYNSSCFILFHWFFSRVTPELGLCFLHHSINSA